MVRTPAEPDDRRSGHEFQLGVGDCERTEASIRAFVESNRSVFFVFFALIVSFVVHGMSLEGLISGGFRLEAEENWREQMGTFRRKSAEQEIKGTAQKIKGVGQEVVGRATGNDKMRAKGEVNQAAGHLRSRAGEAGRKMANAVDRGASKTRRRV